MKNYGSSISVLLCVFFLVIIACFTVNAEVIYQSGDWFYEKINNETEFEIDHYKGTAETIKTYRAYNSIPITSIGSDAFISNTTLKSITINSSVKYVQNSAFFDASALENVVFSSNIELVDYYAFANCYSLKNINLEDTKIAKISYGCFMNCTSLSEITLPDTVTTISENAFAYCESLAKITIPESVTTIHDKAFYKSPNVVIYCYKDSAAHVYAESKGIEYVLLEPVETYLLGDVDGDNQVTIMDPTCLQLLLAHFIADEDGRMFIRSDIDHDGLNSIMDATCIQRYIAQFEDGTDIGKIYEY